MTAATDHADRVDVWFDSSCPFTWVTSRWLVEFAGQRPVDLAWHPMSLGITNEGNEIPPEWQERVARGWQGARLMAAVYAEHGSDALGRLYTAVGRRLHVDGRTFDREVAVEALAEAGLPETLADALDDERWNGPLRTSHEEGQAAVGTTTGSPVVALAGKAFFGPILTTIPRGEDAVRLYDGLALAYSVPSFAELKRGRDGAPVPS